MFGYVRPLKGEMKVKEYEAFKSVYCGLCHSLGRRCGPAARFLVNYDLTFLAMLISENASPCISSRRCIASPFRKKKCLCACTSLDRAADYSVILIYWKLKDTIADERFFKSVGANIAAAALKGAYKKAAAAENEFDLTVRDGLERLGELERSGCTSLDEAADKFASILASASSGASNPARRRELEQILYHVGRIVYILDAADDLKRDFEKGAYNAVAARYGITNGILPDEDKLLLRETLRQSVNISGAAFELMEKSPWTDILANIIHLGIPAAIELVLSGKWHDIKKETYWEKEYVRPV